MNEALITNWNKFISEDDRVYHLGDVVFGGFSKFTENMRDTIHRLNGSKILIGGNHDYYGKGLVEYAPYFDKILGSKEFSLSKSCTGILTHIPVHASQLDHRFKFNIHGHLHSNIIDDSRYLNVSVEQFDFSPVSLDEVKLIMKRRGIN